MKKKIPESDEQNNIFHREEGGIHTLDSCFGSPLVPADSDLFSKVGSYSKRRNLPSYARVLRILQVTLAPAQPPAL